MFRPSLAWKPWLWPELWPMVVNSHWIEYNWYTLCTVPFQPNVHGVWRVMLVNTWRQCLRAIFDHDGHQNGCQCYPGGHQGEWDAWHVGETRLRLSGMVRLAIHATFIIRWDNCTDCIGDYNGYKTRKQKTYTGRPMGYKSLYQFLRKPAKPAKDKIEPVNCSPHEGPDLGALVNQKFQS